MDTMCIYTVYSKDADESNKYSFLTATNTKNLNSEDNYEYIPYFPSGLLKFTFSASHDFSL